MFQNNRELRRDLMLLVGVGVLFSALGFWVSPVCGCLTLSGCLVISCIHLGMELGRYKKIQKMSEDLSALLSGGKPIAIGAYEEGELSILANQVQKLTLRLTETAEKSREGNAFLAESLADISHQLRTPLTAMNLTVSMLREPNLSREGQLKLTRELSSLLSRIDWLVETLLKLSKLDAGAVVLGKESVSVPELIRMATAPLAMPMDLRNQRLLVHCSHEQFEGDLTWTAEALGNIVKNAMEHTPVGGSITIAAEETPLFTQITVEDTGMGFAPQDIPHLFERFYKGRQSAENSCGIGLALARTVVAAQNGTIQAANTGTGGKFILKFYKQVI